MPEPADDILLAHWTALVGNPLTAPAFAEAVLPPLIGRLAAALLDAHPHEVETAAGDAVMALLKRPHAYDPGKSRLVSYLLMVARHDYLNHRAGERRHHRGRISWDSVELDPAGRNQEADDALSFDDPRLQAAVAALPDPDRRVLDLMRAGERRTPAFAAVLGLSEMPVAEQEAAVKRAKDRIKVALKRAVGGSDG